MGESYNCPKCNGCVMNNNNGDFTCEDCGLNITEVLERIEDRDGPASGVAKAVREAMYNGRTPANRKQHEGNEHQDGGITWE